MSVRYIILVNETLTLYLVENILEFVLRESRALDVLNRSQILRHLLAGFPGDRAHLLLSELLADAGIVSQIDLRADDEARHTRAMMVHLRKPFLAHILKGSGGRDGEANEKDIGLGVRKRSESIIVFLPCRVEEP